MMKRRLSVNGKAKPPQESSCADFEARSTALRTKTEERLDHLTGLLREWEKRLIGRQQPRHVIYVYQTDYGNSDPNDPPYDNEHYCIGIAKYAGKWRLCLGEYNEFQHYFQDVPISWRPITDCTMEERIRVAKYVTELEREIVKTGEEMLPKLDEAICHLEDGLADI
jgi:hypothetical protein